MRFIGGAFTRFFLTEGYWELIEMFAKGNASQWIENELKNKPDSINNASWIRQQVLIESMLSFVEVQSYALKQGHVFLIRRFKEQQQEQNQVKC